MPSSRRLPLAAFLLWTLFVWVGRVRNALTDETLSSGDRLGPLLLSASFVVPALLLGAGWIASRRHGAANGLVASGTIALAAWTVAVWVVRAGDIALGGDHEVGFVVVHVVLAATSIALAVMAARAARWSRTPAETAQVRS